MSIKLFGNSRSPRLQKDIKKKTKAKTKTIKKLKKGKQYQIKVRAYKSVSGTKYYGAWSKVKTTKKVK